MNSRYFKMQKADQMKSYTFRNKHIHVFFNLLANFIASKLHKPSATQFTQFSFNDTFQAEVICDKPFLGSTFNQCIVTNAPTNNDKTQELRIQGVLSKDTIVALLEMVADLKDVDIKFDSIDETCEYLSWKGMVK